MNKVFISYSHDTPEHKELVLALSERLRQDGFETSLDQYVQGTPPQKWPRWMLDQVEWADFVLLVCTETYYRRFRGHEIPGKGKGADWEGAIITQELYDARSVTTKFVPAMFDPVNEQFIPEPVRGHTFYVLNSEANYQSLHDFLLGQAGVEPGPVGESKNKDRRQAAPLSFGNTATTGQHSPQISPTRLTHGAEHLFGREIELAALDNAWADPKIHVLTVVAFGGTGKTSLSFEWMNRRAAADWHGMERVFDWSFYSMGTREQGDASSDSFVKAALIFFGDKEMAESAASAWDKGARLAALIAERPTLLVLDGLEPLQYPPGQQTGKLKDPAVETLLKGLARHNPGLCVVTTRESIADLAPFKNTSVTEMQLHRLSTPAGAELLKNLGVTGNDAEFEKLVEDVKGHALTLNLMGRYLVEAHGGDIRKRDQVDFHEANEEIQGGHAFRVIEAYEKWFFGEKRDGRRLLAVLNILALFDRPANYGCIEALRKQPAIHGLTETLVDQGKAKWNITLHRLQKCGLISLFSPAGDVWSNGASLDTHPIIREYFARQLRKLHLTAWKIGHRRLYEHLTNSTPDKSQPTLEDLIPLYQAVFHGCQAGMHENALQTVMHRRIDRGRQRPAFNALGAFGAHLGAITCFYDQPWTVVCETLSQHENAFLLHAAGFCLQALGRLADAIRPMQAGLEIREKESDWENASIACRNLSDLELTLGNVAEALHDGEMAMIFAARAENVFELIHSRVRFGNALHNAGRSIEALRLVEAAEKMQEQLEPKLPMLYSISGFQYCNLLLDDSERDAWLVMLESPIINISPGIEACNSVSARAQQALKWMESQPDTALDIGVHRLSIAQTVLYNAILEKTPIPPSELLTEKVMDCLRRANDQGYLPFGLLIRCWSRYLNGNIAGALADLDEAWEIAERGPMRLHMADILLYRARLFRDREALKQARAMIEQCGYWRRKEELEDAEAVAGSWPM